MLNDIGTKGKSPLNGLPVEIGLRLTSNLHRGCVAFVFENLGNPQPAIAMLQV
jgi:hypothetical protein